MHKISGSGTLSDRIHPFRVFSQITSETVAHGVVIPVESLHPAVMVRGTTSRGTKKCRKFTFLVNPVNTVPVVTTALAGHYCALTHHRNGCLRFVNRSTLIQ
jgi:hypothetical protein